MPNIDLHIHTAYSDDGELSVKEIMLQCKAANIAYMAITDHNTVKGVPEALALGGRMNIGVISGVELDCTHMGKNFHLLGYHFDHTLPVFLEIEERIASQERSAAQEKIERIKKATGIPLSTQEVLAKTTNGVVTGELIAEILLTREDAARHALLLPYLPGGKRADNPYVNFYWDYFSEGRPAFVPIEYLSFSEGVSLLHKAGGIAVLAHPGQNLKGDYAFLDQLISTGIDGIEAYSSYHNAPDAVYFADMAKKNSLLVTCGSDFHGKTKPAISLCGHGADNEMGDISHSLANVFF